MYHLMCIIQLIDDKQGATVVSAPKDLVYEQLGSPSVAFAAPIVILACAV
jgi:hypothetical protein